MENKINWKIGNPIDVGYYLVTFSDGTIDKVKWFGAAWDSAIAHMNVVAYCNLNEIPPYKESKIEFYITRDKDGTLTLFKDTPFIYNGEWSANTDTIIGLPNSYFPEVLYENSPQKIEIKLITNE